MNELNRYIKQAGEGGFIVKWLKGICYGPFSEKKPPFEYIEVKGEMFQSIHMMNFCLMCGALLVAILEKIVFKKVQARNVGFWKYVEMAIDPNRYFLLNSEIKFK